MTDVQVAPNADVVPTDTPLPEKPSVTSIESETQLFDTLVSRKKQIDEAILPLLSDKNAYATERQNALLYLEALLRQEPFASDLKLNNYYKFIAPALGAAFLVDLSCGGNDYSKGWFQQSLLEDVVPGLGCDNKQVEEWQSWVEKFPFLDSIQKWHGTFSSPYLTMPQRAIFYDFLNKLSSPTEETQCTTSIGIAKSESTDKLMEELKKEHGRAESLLDELKEARRQNEVLARERVACDTAKSTIQDQLTMFQDQLQQTRSAKEDLDQEKAATREAALQKRIAELEGELKPIKERSQALDAKIVEQNATETQLQSQVADLENRVIALQTEAQQCHQHDEVSAQERDQAIKERDDALASLSDAEQKIKLSFGEKSDLQSALETAEQKLLETEAEKEKEKRAAEEAKRIADEEKRVAEEEKRAAEEAKRIAEEEKRAAEEEKRAAEEEKRVAEEEKRVADEEKRVAEEAKRIADEEKRVADEEKRVAEMQAANVAALVEEQRRALQVLEESKKKQLQQASERTAALEKELIARNKREQRMSAAILNREQSLIECQQHVNQMEAHDEENKRAEIAAAEEAHKEFLQRIVEFIGTQDFDSDDERFQKLMKRFDQKDSEYILQNLASLRAQGKLPKSAGSKILQLQQQVAKLESELRQAKDAVQEASSRCESILSDLDTASNAVIACQSEKAKQNSADEAHLQNQLNALTQERNALRAQHEASVRALSDMTSNIRDLEAVREFNTGELEKCKAERERLFADAESREKTLLDQLKKLKAQYDVVDEQLKITPKVDPALFSQMRQREAELTAALRKRDAEWKALQQQVEAVVRDETVSKRDKMLLQERLAKEKQRSQQITDELEKAKVDIADANKKLAQIEQDREILRKFRTQCQQSMKKLQESVQADMQAVAVERDLLREQVRREQNANVDQQKENETLKEALAASVKKNAELEKYLMKAKEYIESAQMQ